MSLSVIGLTEDKEIPNVCTRATCHMVDVPHILLVSRIQKGFEVLRVPL